MVLFNHATREMTAKIVYYGPGLCGKTTNLMVIFDKLDPKSKGKMLSLATKTDRTLFFDLLPVDIGKVGPFNLKMQLYTVPGQVFYNETRKLVLRGADAVVFVADSQPAMIEATKESFSNLLDNMRENQIDPKDTPIVVQYNKRDLPGVLPVEKLQKALGLEEYPFTEASAIQGEGVMETFKLVSKITAKHLFNRLKGKSEPLERGKVAAKPPAPKVAKPAAKPVKSAPIPEPEPEPETDPFMDQTPISAASNPFGDPVPFPESNPLNSGYEKMEEVSLEQLLSEGRKRPATFSGTVPVPMDDIEEMGEHEIVSIPEPTPVAAAVMDEPVRKPAPSAKARGPSQDSSDAEQLKKQLETVRTESRIFLKTLLRELDELRERIREHIE